MENKVETREDIGVIGAEIITNIMVPYSVCNDSIWYLNWTSK